ncbi:PspA/IM30 family protein [Gammaproteobacteria bacterium]|jgi:phage shock protein A|nr:PspA/IM30 family protein [Gammaproteobacteria bacterium]|tara:strand:- start:153 stop:845 length:693 start_codon:yes stop_codon:yes gene_type:complete
MSILKDLFKAIKGGVSEVGESVVDANLVRILEQDIRDDSNAINKAKQSLTQLKGTEIGLKRKIDSLATDIADYEAKTVEALEAGKEELAIQVAEKIADLESEKDMLFTEHTALAKEVVQLNKMIKTRSSNLEKGKRELEKIKTVEQLQKTTASINKNFASTKSSGNRVADSLARAKKKQQEWKDNQKAGDWMEEEESSSDLDKKLSEEGIGGKKTSANDIIERLKNKNKS